MKQASETSRDVRLNSAIASACTVKKKMEGIRVPKPTSKGTSSCARDTRAKKTTNCVIVEAMQAPIKPKGIVRTGVSTMQHMEPLMVVDIMQDVFIVAVNTVP